MDPDILKWFSTNEKMIYDTETYNIKLSGNSCRGIVTDKRTIFYTLNNIQDVYHDLVASIAFTRKLHYKLLILGILLIVAGAYLYYKVWFTDEYLFLRNSDFSYYFFSIIIIGGAVLIAMYILDRPEALTIFSAGISLSIDAPRKNLEMIMRAIRNNMPNDKKDVG